jgi:DNA/RNA-binding domain of Phe-tRNA-synthetase-like protein
LQLQIDPSLKAKFPGLRVLVQTIDDVVVTRTTASLEELKKIIADEVKSKYTLESLKDVPIFRAYRDFFWRAGIDPTKVRPAAEALIRRILANKPIPTINTLVDAYNLASIKTGIALAAFDRKELLGTLSMHTATEGDEFHGIGISEPMRLNGGEIVISDAKKFVAVYPYRDADTSKVTERTKNIMLMVCGCPGIDEAPLVEAQRVACNFIVRFCGGRVS